MSGPSRILLSSILLLLSSALFASEASSAEICSFEEGMTFEDWQSWEKLTHKPIFSKGHSSNWVDIYVNELAEETYRDVGDLYPVCAKIVKAAYEDEAGTEFWSLTVMVKMPPGYDPEHGDWWYAIYHDAAGVKPVKQGRLYKECIQCHLGAVETDYLFSHDVMIEIEKK